MLITAASNRPNVSIIIENVEICTVEGLTYSVSYDTESGLREIQGGLLLKEENYSKLADIISTQDIEEPGLLPVFNASFKAVFKGQTADGSKCEMSLSNIKITKIEYSLGYTNLHFIAENFKPWSRIKD